MQRLSRPTITGPAAAGHCPKSHAVSTTASTAVSAAATFNRGGLSRCPVISNGAAASDCRTIRPRGLHLTLFRGRATSNGRSRTACRGGSSSPVGAAAKSRAMAGISRPAVSILTKGPTYCRG